MRFITALVTCLAVAGSTTAFAESCPGNPDALGTSRLLTISPGEFSRIGTMQYRQTLPLADHEVVITFDDGPLPPYSDRILETLASQCVKVNYFLVGQMARAYPWVVRRMYNEGHTIGTHSLDHPLIFQNLGADRVEHEVDGGIARVDAALGDPNAVSPFFRIPGLGRSKVAESFLAEHSLVTWSADVVADDWFRHIGAQQIVQRAMRRLEAKGRGILLLHDIHPATAMALPMLLKQLKAKGFHVVHVVAAGERPKSVPELVASHEKQAWPTVLKTSARSETSDEEKSAAMKHHRVKTASIRKRRAVAAGVTAIDYYAAAHQQVLN
jgi:peptidoglycan/xylan/chitin deacetylase (PgdA/CDA1 family)